MNYFDDVNSAKLHLKYLSENEKLILEILLKYKFITKDLLVYLKDCKRSNAYNIIKKLINEKLIKIATNNFSKEAVYILTSKGFEYLEIDNESYNLSSTLSHELKVLEVAIFLSKKYALNIIEDFKVHKDIWQPMVNKHTVTKEMFKDYDLLVQYSEHEKIELARKINAKRHTQYIPDLRIEKLRKDIEIEISHKKSNYMKKKYEKGYNTDFFVFNLRERNPFTYTNIYSARKEQEYTKVYDLNSKEVLITCTIDYDNKKFIIDIDRNHYDLEYVQKTYYSQLDEIVQNQILLREKVEK